MREPEPVDDALERHLVVRQQLLDLPALPPAVRGALDYCEPRSTLPGDHPVATLREYTAALDARAHPDAARNSATADSLSDENLALLIDALDSGQPDKVHVWMGQLLGLGYPARIRTSIAFGRRGLHRYSLANGNLEALWADSIAKRPDEHPLLRGARLYFDAIFLHPYDNGNSRLGRALLAVALGNQRGIDFAGLVWMPKRPGRLDDFFRFVMLTAKSSTTRTGSDSIRRSQGVRDELSPWPEVMRDVRAFDRVELSEAMTRLLDTNNLDTNSAWDIADRYLKAKYPSWYAATTSWRIGQETLGGCVCHNLRDAIVKGPASAAEWIVGEVELLVRCLSQFDIAIDIASEGDHATEHVDAVIVATGRIIDVMILNGWTSECWYRYADDGVRWLLSEVTSIDPRNAILPPLSSHDFAFSSWCEPPPRKVIEFSETAGVIAEHLGKGPSDA